MKPKLIFAFLMVLLFSCASKKDLKTANSKVDSLQQRTVELESMMKDIDRDGIPDYLDIENNSVAGAMVDTKGRMIDINNDGVPDQYEKYPVDGALNDSTAVEDVYYMSDPPQYSHHPVAGAKKGPKTTPLSATFNSEKTVKLVYPETVAGNISFFCERQMREDETYEVHAMMSPLFKAKEIQDELLNTINESRRENNEPLFTIHDIITKNVDLGYYVTIELKDPAKKFTIDLASSDPASTTKKIFDDATNQFSNEAFEWKWNVTPKPDSKGNAKLELVITPMNKDRKQLKEKRKTYDIKIVLKQSMVASIWEEMNRNPKWTVGSIITPILTFLTGRYLKKKTDGATAT
jgi:hypothetical protein